MSADSRCRPWHCEQRQLCYYTSYLLLDRAIYGFHHWSNSHCHQQPVLYVCQKICSPDIDFSGMLSDVKIMFYGVAKNKSTRTKSRRSLGVGVARALSHAMDTISLCGNLMLDNCLCPVAFSKSVCSWQRGHSQTPRVCD